MTETPPPPPQAAAPEPPKPPRHRSHRLLVVLVTVIVVCIAFLVGALPRLRTRHKVRQETAELAIPNVAVISPQRAPPAQKLRLPGSVQAYASAPIFAKATGFVRKWYVDIGAHVKANQLLAEIEIPETEQQLENARGSLAAAQANLRTSEATAKRFTALQQTRAVSQQEVDNAVGAFKANQATVQAAQATVGQLEKLLSYAQIRAPFEGVVTQRNIDIGDLVNAGAGGTALFQIVQSAKLRVYITVPEAYSRAVTPGMTATLTTVALPGRELTGKLVRTASAIDPATRTLLVEIQVDNPTGELFAGAYSEVQLDIPAVEAVFVIPVEALLFRGEGLQVATVAQNGRVVLKQVMPGRDFGDRIEIVHGLDGSERVITNPPDSISNGVAVRISNTAEARRAR